MTHRGTRSHRGVQRQAIRRILISRGHRDRERREVINLITSTEIIHILGKKFSVVYPSLIPELERGEVLIDSRCEGSLQRSLWS